MIRALVLLHSGNFLGKMWKMANRSGKRYFLLDQSLKMYSGHCYEYFKPIKDLIESRGDKAILVGNVLAERQLVEETGTIPLLTYWCDERNVGQPPSLPVKEDYDAIRASHERVIAQDMAQLDDKFSIRGNDIIIINTIRHWGMRGVVDWIENIPEGNRPFIVMILHFTGLPEPNYYDHAIDHYKDAFERIERSIASRHFHLMADSEQLVAEYEELTSLKVELAPIPHTISHPANSKPAEGAPLRIGYSGEARMHKGFNLLPFLVRSIEREPASRPVEFHLHAYCLNPRAEFFRIAMAQLEQCGNVVLYKDIMDPEGYRKFIGTIDIFLIPYALSNYYRQTSGIYTEAIALGRPAVVSRGTWMASHLKRQGGGRECITDDHMSLLSAVREVVDNYDELRAEALNIQKSWLQFHKPESLLFMIDRAAANKMGLVS